MGVFSNSMIITNVGDYAQRIVAGLVLIAAVAFDIYSIYSQKRREARAEQPSRVNIPQAAGTQD